MDSETLWLFATQIHATGMQGPDRKREIERIEDKLRQLLFTENATIRRQLEAMTAARDAWREEARPCARGGAGHAIGCLIFWDGPNSCDCPAALDAATVSIPDTDGGG